MVLLRMLFIFAPVFKNLKQKMKNVLKSLFVAIVAMSVTFAYAQNNATTTKTDTKTVKTDKKGKKTVKTAKKKKATTTTTTPAK